MYEKIVNYFESNLSLENIYFRRKKWLWILGNILIVLIEVIINYIIFKFIINMWIRIGVMLLIDFFIALSFLIFVYVLPVNKIYRGKIKEKTKIDLVGILMKEQKLSKYRKIEIKEMEKFIKKKCKINNIESIDTIIDMINEEIEYKYTKMNFMDKYFNNAILPILISVLTIYFTNTNEQNITNILVTTITSIGSIIITGVFIMKIKNGNIIPVNKKENLLELKRVLMDIKIEWSKR